MLLMLVGSQPSQGKACGWRPISLPGECTCQAQLGTMWLWQGSQVCWPRPTGPLGAGGTHGSLS